MASIATATPAAAATASTASASAAASTPAVSSASPSHDGLCLEAPIGDALLAAEAERIAELLFLEGTLVHRSKLNGEHRGAAEVAYLFGSRYLFERLGERHDAWTNVAGDAVLPGECAWLEN